MTPNDELAAAVASSQGKISILMVYDKKAGSYQDDAYVAPGGAPARKPRSPADKAPFGTLR